MSRDPLSSRPGYCPDPPPDRWPRRTGRLAIGVLVWAGLTIGGCAPTLHVGLKTPPGDDPLQIDRNRR